jgi:hypothetical protein
VVVALFFGPLPRTSRKGALVTLATLTALGVMIAVTGTSGARGMITVVEMSGWIDHITRVVGAGAAQIRHLAWPFELLPMYAPDITVSGFDYFVVIIVAVAVAGLVAWALRQGNRPVLFFLTFTLFYYAPVSNILPLNRFTADSYAYAPIAGIAGLVSCVLSEIWRRTEILRYRRVSLLASVVLISGLSALTCLQQRIWQNAETLWTAVLEARPNDIRAQEGFGGALIHRNKKMDALDYFRENEARWRKMGRVPIAYMTLLAGMGFDDEAEALFLWSLGNSDVKKESVARNYIRFLLNTGRVPARGDWELAQQALRAFVDSSILSAAPERLVHIARLAGDIGDFEMAELLITRAVSKDANPIYLEMGRAACRARSGLHCEKRWPVQKQHLR